MQIEQRIQQLDLENSGVLRSISEANEISCKRLKEHLEVQFSSTARGDQENKKLRDQIRSLNEELKNAQKELLPSKSKQSSEYQYLLEKLDSISNEIVDLKRDSENPATIKERMDTMEQVSKAISEKLQN